VGNTTIKQDSKFEQLLNERKINVSNAVNDYYKFKYSVVIAKSKNTLAEFRQAFSGMDGTIIFNTPNQSMGGNYKSRIEGNVTLSILKKISKRTFDTTNKVIYILYVKTEQIARFF
jgi:hypothetical protein